jgi:hypothetical protein
MHGSKVLPKEILTDIVSRLSGNTKDLLSCSLASRDLGEAAKSALYFDIDLNLERFDQEGDADVERQQKLLSTIAQ